MSGLGAPNVILGPALGSVPGTTVGGPVQSDEQSFGDAFEEARASSLATSRATPLSTSAGHADPSEAGARFSIANRAAVGSRQPVAARPLFSSGLARRANSDANSEADKAGRSVASDSTASRSVERRLPGKARTKADGARSASCVKNASDSSTPSGPGSSQGPLVPANAQPSAEPDGTVNGSCSGASTAAAAAGSVGAVGPVGVVGAAGPGAAAAGVSAAAGTAGSAAPSGSARGDSSAASRPTASLPTSASQAPKGTPASGQIVPPASQATDRLTQMMPTAGAAESTGTAQVANTSLSTAAAMPGTAVPTQISAAAIVPAVTAAPTAPSAISAAANAASAQSTTASPVPPAAGASAPDGAASAGIPAAAAGRPVPAQAAGAPVSFDRQTSPVGALEGAVTPGDVFSVRANVAASAADGASGAVTEITGDPAAGVASAGASAPAGSTGSTGSTAHRQAATASPFAAEATVGSTPSTAVRPAAASADPASSGNAVHVVPQTASSRPASGQPTDPTTAAPAAPPAASPAAPAGPVARASETTSPMPAPSVPASQPAASQPPAFHAAPRQPAVSSQADSAGPGASQVAASNETEPTTEAAALAGASVTSGSLRAGDPAAPSDAKGNVPSAGLQTVANAQFSAPVRTASAATSLAGAGPVSGLGLQAESPGSRTDQTRGRGPAAGNTSTGNWSSDDSSAPGRSTAVGSAPYSAPSLQAVPPASASAQSIAAASAASALGSVSRSLSAATGSTAGSPAPLDLAQSADRLMGQVVQTIHTYQTAAGPTLEARVSDPDLGDVKLVVTGRAGEVVQAQLVVKDRVTADAMTEAAARIHATSDALAGVNVTVRSETSGGWTAGGRGGDPGTASWAARDGGPGGFGSNAGNDPSNRGTGAGQTAPGAGNGSTSGSGNGSGSGSSSGSGGPSDGSPTSNRQTVTRFDQSQLNASQTRTRLPLPGGPSLDIRA
jgi:hypothetical protein